MSEETTSGRYTYIFTTSDYNNRDVVLKHGTFVDKILPKHPELTPDIIKNGVESPHLITSDPINKNRRRYYRYIPNPNEEMDNITNLKVVVEDKNSKHDEVVTAYLLRDLKNEHIKGRIIYDSGSASRN